MTFENAVLEIPTTHTLVIESMSRNSPGKWRGVIENIKGQSRPRLLTADKPLVMVKELAEKTHCGGCRREPRDDLPVWIAGLCNRAPSSDVQQTKFYVIAPTPAREYLGKYDHFLNLLESIARTEHHNFVCNIGRLSLASYYFCGRQVTKHVLANGALSQTLRPTVVAFLKDVACLPINVKTCSSHRR